MQVLSPSVDALLGEGVEKSAYLYRKTDLTVTKGMAKERNCPEKERLFNSGCSVNGVSPLSKGRIIFLSPSVSYEGVHIPAKQMTKPMVFDRGVTYESGHVTFAFPHVLPLKKKKEKKESFLSLLLKVLGFGEALR